MSRKLRLFASVAAPVLSLPLMIQPAGAMPLKPAIEAIRMPAVIQVQQQIIIPPSEGGAGQSEQREQAPAEAEQQTEQPRRQRQAEPQAAPEAAPREAPAAEAPAQERPQRRQQAEQSEGSGEQPRRQRQQAGEGAGEGEGGRERPRREQAAPQTEEPAAREAQQPRDGQQQPQDARPVDAAPEGSNRQQRRNAEDRNAAPVQNQAETPAQPPRAGEPAATPQAPAGDPVRRNAEGQQPTPGQTTPVAPSQAAPGQPQTAQTPEQVERARQIARDPASARSGEQVVLPVENGAAVLDSAKEAPAVQSAPTGNGQQPPRQQVPSQAQQADQQQLAPPTSDAEAQGGIQGATQASREQQRDFRALVEERGERLDRRPDFDRPGGWDYRDADSRNGNRRDRDRDGGRVIISIDNQTVVRNDDSRRFYEDGREPEYERLRDGRFREVIERGDGTRVVTIRNRYGEIVQRSRVVRGGEEYVLYYAPELMDERRGRDYVWRDPGLDLPPMRLSVPLDDYIIDTSTEPDRDYYEFLEQPPVERVERVYSLDEVRYSARIRDKVRRIDLDTVTFATGSAEIPMNQASSLRKVAEAIDKVLKNDPSETFLIEGHTDAVGSDDSNLVLSDERAESVARVLTDAFAIPPENLATQGYGERYLKVRTDGPEQDNRRVTIRRITPLVKPVAARQ